MIVNLKNNISLGGNIKFFIDTTYKYIQPLSVK